MGLFSKLFKKKKETSVKSEADVKSVKQPEVTVNPTEAKIADETTVKEQADAPKTESVSSPRNNVEEAKPQSSKKTVKNEIETKKPKKKEPQPDNEKISEQDELDEDKKAFTGKFEINRSKDGKKFFFNLFASNKVGIATSQMYSSAQSALTGVKSVIVNAPKAPIEDQTLKTFETLPNPKWEIYLDNGNKYRFRLNATNGSCVCHSQGYTTKTACKNGIDSIIRSSKNAQIVKTYLAKDE